MFSVAKYGADNTPQQYHKADKSVNQDHGCAKYTSPYNGSLLVVSFCLSFR